MGPHMVRVYNAIWDALLPLAQEWEATMTRQVNEILEQALLEYGAVRSRTGKYVWPEEDGE